MSYNHGSCHACGGFIEERLTEQITAQRKSATPAERIEVPIFPI